jgi:hypothetical protein
MPAVEGDVHGRMQGKSLLTVPRIVKAARVGRERTITQVGK